MLTLTSILAVALVLAAAAYIPFIRRKLLTDRVLALYRRILPDMSQTEKEAIDAGTVWWDGDLFSGRPDFDKLLAVPEPRLSAEEQAFLDGPVEELCAMCDDWEITHELQDLPAHVWRSEEHTSELQSRLHLVCRLLLEKKKNEREKP